MLDIVVGGHIYGEKIGFFWAENVTVKVKSFYNFFIFLFFLNEFCLSPSTTPDTYELNWTCNYVLHFLFILMVRR